MVLFGNKQEFEDLYAENNKLKDKAALLEVRLSVKDKNIVEMQRKIDELKSRNDEYATSIDRLEIAASEKVSFLELEKIRQEYLLKIQDLERQLAASQIRPHNERNAGRKRKATPEQVSLILSLKEHGKSDYEIARIFTQKYGVKWNKSTVRNTVILAEK